MQKFLTIFSKNIAAVDFVSTVSLNKSSSNDFIKLAMLRTPGPKHVGYSKGEF